MSVEAYLKRKAPIAFGHLSDNFTADRFNGIENVTCAKAVAFERGYRGASCVIRDVARLRLDYSRKRRFGSCIRLRFRLDFRLIHGVDAQ